VNVEQQMVLCRFLDGFRDPRRFRLRTDIHKTNLDPFDAPFFIKGKQNIPLCFNLPPIHIKN
jgi:hypothetical protein